MGRFAITMAEYNRVHQVIHGAIQEEGRVERACTFFSIVGSYLLNRRFGIAATAVAGGFALCVADGPRCMFYGKEDGGRFSWGDDGFHMWVQTEHHIIDFMAPIYQEAFAAAGPDVAIPRRMFQRPRAEDKARLDDLQRVGDYIVFPDPELSERMIDRFLGRAANTDLLEIIDAWFGSRRGRQRPSLTIGSNDGIVRNLTLPDTLARSAW